MIDPTEPRRYAVHYSDPFGDNGDPTPNIWHCFAQDADDAMERFYDRCAFNGESFTVERVTRVPRYRAA